MKYLNKIGICTLVCTLASSGFNSMVFAHSEAFAKFLSESLTHIQIMANSIKSNSDFPCPRYYNPVACTINLIDGMILPYIDSTLENKNNVENLNDNGKKLTGIEKFKIKKYKSFIKNIANDMHCRKLRSSSAHVHRHYSNLIKELISSLLADIRRENSAIVEDSFETKFNNLLKSINKRYIFEKKEA